MRLKMTKSCNCKEKTTDLQKAAGEIVAGDDVKYIIGFGSGSYASRTKPIFVRTPEDADKLIWSPLCVNNLSVFLKHAEKLPVPRGQEPDTRKVGIIVKGCDVRALNQLMQELTIERENIVIIGIACGQCIDPVKFEEKLNENGIGLNANLNVFWENDSIIVENLDASGERVVLEPGELVLDKCGRCEAPTPEEADITIGEKIGPYAEDKFEDLKELEAMTREEKEKFWDGQFDKCIRCYACRNICPVCVCKTCVLDSLKPQWVERGTDFDKKKLFHLMRAYCMLGRCIDCGECERACPANIPLTKLYREGLKVILEAFDYIPGKNRTDKPIFTQYDSEDTGGTIW
jgi:coenzyme F420-reducing hydrogenase beta subunit